MDSTISSTGSCSGIAMLMGSAGPRVGFDDLVQVEQDFERAFENDDHWRSVVPSTRRLVVFILSYALRLVKRIAEPISLSLHLDRLGGAAGVGAATVLSVVVLVLISFAAGIRVVDVLVHQKNIAIVKSWCQSHPQAGVMTALQSAIGPQ